jgi:hypothetical protein
MFESKIRSGVAKAPINRGGCLFRRRTSTMHRHRCGLFVAAVASPLLLACEEIRSLLYPMLAHSVAQSSKLIPNYRWLWPSDCFINGRIVGLLTGNTSFIYLAISTNA